MCGNLYTSVDKLPCPLAYHAALHDAQASLRRRQVAAINGIVRSSTAGSSPPPHPASMCHMAHKGAACSCERCACRA